MMKRLLTVLLTMLICLASPAFATEEEPALTLMVYLCGSDLETSSGAATADLEEMISYYPADGSLQVLVMASGAQKWHNDVSASETAIYELTGAGLEKVHTLPLQSMGEPDTLRALLDYGYAQSLESRHALILWDHGAGPLLGVCFDEQFSNGTGMDGLTLAELTQALSQSPAADSTLNWIGFDACLMASVETACAVAPYAQYMIASQDTEPVTGWSYSFLTEAGHDATGADTGRRIIDAYFDSLGNTLAPATLSCVELSMLPAIGEAMDSLFNALHLTLDDQSYPDFAACRVNTKSVGCSTTYEYDLVDLVDLLQVYRDEGVAECSELLSLLDEAIVESRSNAEYINGLTIHYPHYGSERDTPDVPSQEYSAFMADMSAIRLGEPLTDWSSQQQLQAALADGATLVTLGLTPEQAAHLASARLYIFKEMKGNDYQLIYQTDDVELTEEDVLQAVYEEQALYLIDGEGNITSESLPYYLTEGGLVLRCMLFNADWTTENFMTVARLIFRLDEEGHYRLSEALEITDDPALQGKVTVNLDDYDYLAVQGSSFCPVYDEDGRLLPPGKWTSGDYVYGWEFLMADYPGWSVAFHSQQDSRQRAAVLQLTDTQNNVICSELLPIENPNLTNISTERRLLVENEYCRIYYTGAQQVLGTYPQLRLLLECENLHSEQISIGVRRLQFDQTVVERGTGSSPAIDPGTSKAFQLDLGQEALALLGVRQAEQLAMEFRVNINYFDEMCREYVTFPCELDMSQVIPEPVEHRVMATTEWAGLEMSLCDLKVESDALKGVLIVRNTTAEEITFEDDYAIYINDVRISASPFSLLTDMTLPAGAVVHMAVEVDLTKGALLVNRPAVHGTMLQELGVTQLETLGITLCQDAMGDECRVDFTLEEPLALPQQTSPARVDSWPVLYDRDGVCIRLMDITWQEDTNRNINLYIQSSLDQTAEFYIPLFTMPEWGMRIDCYVNGIELPYLSTPASIEPRAVTYEDLGYVADTGYMDIEELVLTFTIQDEQGRSDKVRAVIVPTSEPKQAEGFYYYDAEQLQVSAEMVE